MRCLAGSRARPCWLAVRAAVLGLLLASPLVAERTFDVGPNQALGAIAEVPWEALQAGDLVRIHWRPEPYREKWAICAVGTAAAPIRVTGVAGPQGQLPAIEGNGATCRKDLVFWGEDRAILKIGGTNAAPDLMPCYIVVENLELSGARPPLAFTGRNGKATYRDNAAAIWIEKGQHITVRNCVLHDCGNGLMSSRETHDLMVEGCSIYGNGTEVGIYQHNVYTETEGIIFQFNHLGPLRTDSFGINLKDRSSGTVVRYNWIEGGNRLIDLVESDYPHIYKRADYRQTFVYGNVLIKLADTTNRQIVHYGGDQGVAERYRNGTLYLCHNTVVSRRLGRAALVKLSTPQDKAVVRNNIIWCDSSTGYVQPFLPPGKAYFGTNWCPRQFEAMLRFVRAEEGLYVESEQIYGDEPGFVNAATGDFRLTAGSPCIGRAGPLPEAMLPDHALSAEYVPHCSQRPRQPAGAMDLGALSAGEPVSQAP